MSKSDVVSRVKLGSEMSNIRNQEKHIEMEKMMEEVENILEEDLVGDDT